MLDCAISCFVANPSGFLLILGVFTSMALNLAGGVFVAMMFWGARRPQMQQLFDDASSLASSHQPLVRDSSALSSAQNPRGYEEPNSPLLASTIDVGHVQEHIDFNAEESGASSVGVLHRAIGTSKGRRTPNIALPLSDGLGNAAAVFVCSTFVLAVIYDVFASSCSPLGESWATALTGIAFVLVAHHVVLSTVAALNGSVVGVTDAHVQSDDSMALVSPSPNVLVLGTSATDVPLDEDMRKSCCSLLSFALQCEATAIGGWLTYGVNPSSGALTIVTLFSAWQLTLLLLVVCKPRSPFTTSVVPFFGTLVDSCIMGAWGIAQLSRGDRQRTSGGSIPFGVAVILVGLLLLRWRVMRRG